MCANALAHTRTYTYIHTYIYIYIYAHPPACFEPQAAVPPVLRECSICRCGHIHTCTDIRTHIHACIYACIGTYTCMHLRRPLACIRRRMHALAHTSVHKYIYTYTRTRLLATDYQFVLRIVSLYYGVSVSLYYGVSACTTEYQFLYYGVSACTTEYQLVLRSISLYYGVSVCSTEYQFVQSEFLHKSRIDPA